MDEESVRVDAPLPPLVRLTLAGLRAVVRPAGETVVVRDIVPEKLLMLDRLIVVVFEVPVWMVRLERLLERLKSGPTTSV